MTAFYNFAKKSSDEEKGENWEGTFSWDNNNLKTIKYTYKEIENGKTTYEDNSTYTYTYGEVLNKARQNTYIQLGYQADFGGIEFLGQTGLLGKATALFPVSAHCAYTIKTLTNGKITEHSNEYEDPVEYKLNEDGTIDVETIDGDDYEYSYTTIEGK